MFQSITCTSIYLNYIHYIPNIKVIKLFLFVAALTDVYDGDTFSVHQISKDKNNQCITTEQNDVNKTMFENITTILAYVKRIDAKLDAIGCNLNTSYSSTNVENNFLSLFPMKTMESLDDIESKLILDNVFEEKLVCK